MVVIQFSKMAKLVSLVLLSILFISLVFSQDSVTWYDYYTAGGRQSGLVPANADGFTLNGKPFRVVSGAMHYFRIHPAYWRDRLRKLRAVGANTVETYLPWNLHEPRQGVFDFGTGGNDMSDFLDLRTYVQIAREEDLFVILRPGPFICAEWDFGGMPTWLLRDANMKVRTNYPGYLDASREYYNAVFKQIADLQFTKGDGPIIAFQIENEYAAFGSDTSYLINLRQAMIDEGCSEMFFTSDNGGFDRGSIPGTLTTANFNSNGEARLNELRALQPDFPLMVTEYWSGWFDHWGQGYHDSGLNPTNFRNTLTYIFDRKSSVNFYMFHGGSNFGFLNGANGDGNAPFYQPTISSYDYGAPLSEAGDYTEKYNEALAVIEQYQWIPNLVKVDQPAPSVKTAYPAISATQHLTLDNLLSQVPPNLVLESPILVAMEDLPINGNNGQSYGYVHYRKTAQLTSGQHTVQITGRPHDLAVFMVDGQRQTAAWDNNDKLTTFGYYGAVDASLDFTAANTATYTMDFLVECMGRVNYGGAGNFVDKCGLTKGPVVLDGSAISDWTIYPLEFTKAWINTLTGWNNSPAPASSLVTPTLTRSVFTISGTPTDTFLNAGEFGADNRGVVFVNGFNIGRFSGIGPTKTMYIPAPLLQSGRNTIDVFALFTPVTDITFTTTPNLG